MLKWIPYVMVRIAVIFIAGILLGIYQPNLLPESATQMAILILVGLYFFSYQFFKRNFRLKTITGFIGLFAIFLCGYWLVLLRTESRQPDHLLYFTQPVEYYSALVTSVPEERIKSWKITLELERVMADGKWNRVRGKSLLYVSKKSKWNDLRFGDRILIHGSPQALSSPANPGEFDFKRFLSFRNIYHQHFVRSDEITVIHHAKTRGILYYSSQARTWASDKIKNFITGEQERAIALALVLGVIDGLDNELQNAYSASGAMHVLAVSGLHVGIIYWMLLIILKPVSSLSWSRWLIAIVSLVCLWGYAFVTGLSPSVLRAVTMFSFIALARPFGINTNIYNTLAASAFLLLIYNPYLIMSVGFQLSYLAVLGIVYLQRPIYNLWETTSFFWDKVWQITCVSIAAQIATFALGLLYFHQFPTYFLFSNLFVIPASFFILILGIGLLAVSFIQPLAAATGWLLENTIKILNQGVFAVENLPFSLINGVHITTLQCWLLMAIVVSMLLVFEFKKFQFALLALGFALIFSFLQWSHYWQDVNKKQFVVYAIPGHFAMEWINQGKSIFVADSALLQDEERVRFHIRPNRVQAGIIKVKYENPSSGQRFPGFTLFVENGIRFLRIESKDYYLPQTLDVDYLIVGNNSVHSIGELMTRLTFKQLVFDSSNTSWYVDRIRKELQARNIVPYSVLHQKAFVKFYNL